MEESGWVGWEYNCRPLSPHPCHCLAIAVAIIRFIRGAIITAIAYFIVCRQYCWIADVIGTCKVEEEKERSLNVSSPLVLQGMCAFGVLLKVVTVTVQNHVCCEIKIQT